MSTTPDTRPAAGPRPRRSRRLAVGATLGAVALAAGIGLGLANASGGTTADPAAASAAGAPAPDGGFAGRGGPVDGETHVPGTVTAVAADSVTVQGDDGATATYTVDSGTQVLDDGRAVSVTDLASGD